MTNKQFEWSIKTRVMIMVAVPAVVISIVLTLYLLFSQTSEIEYHLQDKGEQITRDVAFMSEFALISGDRENLRATLKAFIKDSEIFSIHILNKRRESFLEISNPSLDGRADSMNNLLSFEAPVYLTRVEVNTFDISDDLILNEPEDLDENTDAKVLGYVLVDISRASLDSKRLRLIVTAILLAIITLIASLVIGHRLGRSITGPVGDIIQAVRKIRGGEYKTRINSSQTDEVAKLSHDIDELAGELQSSKRQVNKQLMELTEERQKADLANAAKSRFLALMSHELRDPLNAVNANLQVLEGMDIPYYQRQFLDVSKISLNQLLQLIQNILDFSQAEAGKLNVSLSYFDLREVIDNMIALHQPGADKKQLRLSSSCAIQAELNGCNLYSDPTRIQQILINIIGNAIKYTQEGSIYVCAELTKRSDTKAWLKIEVRDTGIGIPDEKLDSIFDLFEQVSAPSYRREGGAGMGLANTKLFANALGGSVTVQSQLMKGSSFVFEMEVEYAFNTKPIDKIEEMPVLSSQQKQSKRILLVEDNPNNRLGVEGLMHNVGIDIDIASDGIEGLEKFSKQFYDLVFLDCFMPGMDGFELARKIREVEKQSYIGQYAYLVAVTAWAQNEVKEQCFEAGMNEVVIKPFSKFDLYERVKRIMDGEEQIKKINELFQTQGKPKKDQE